MLIFVVIVVSLAVTPAMVSVLLVPFKPANCVLRFARSADEFVFCGTLIMVTPLPFTVLFF